MDDLIDRQEAIDALNACCVKYDKRTDKEKFYDWWDMHKVLSMRIINDLPSAQLERHYCRECKWSRCHINLDKYGRSETYWHCLNWDGETDEEGFCHEWERIADEQID